jgi:pimeloyl-ACP methyl ester carboxylesterase
VVFLIGVLAYFIALYLFQRSLLFPVEMIGPVTHNASNAEIVELSGPAAGVRALYLAPIGGPDGAAPLFLFTHGNAEFADDWVTAFDEPRRWGWAALLLEYPGYGRSDGRPSERSITDAALAAYDWARRDQRIDSTRIVPYGRSLGGGAAARLAADRPVAALILESAFTSVRQFARRYLAPGFLVRDPFDNLAALASYRGPLLVMHGTHDQIIPVEHGRRLAARVPGAQLVELSCGHNDCPRQWATVRAFLEARGLADGSAPGTR